MLCRKVAGSVPDEVIGVERGRCVGLSGQCGILDVSKVCRPPRPAAGSAATNLAQFCDPMLDMELSACSTRERALALRVINDRQIMMEKTHLYVNAELKCTWEGPLTQARVSSKRCHYSRSVWYKPIV
jgi:hypothetical protein